MKKLIKQTAYISIAIAVLLGAFGCKARKVALTRIDSVSTIEASKVATIKETAVDTSKIAVNKQVIISDTSGVKTIITPVEGKPVTVENGVFKGEASRVEIVGKKGVNIKSTNTSFTQKGLTVDRVIDSASTKKETVNVSKKIKNTETKPDYSWIVWIIGVLVVIYFGWRLIK